MSKKFYLLVLILILVLVGGFYLNRYYSNRGTVNLVPSPAESSSSIFSPPAVSPADSPTSAAIADSYLIENVPFESQAPFANWDQLHDEACEEATLTIVDYYLNQQALSAQTMDDEIQKMVAWEITNWGVHKDLTIAETNELGKSFYQISGREINDATITDIKREVSQNHLVIVPTAGRMLGNPNFRSPGPVYHMVVVIGYTPNTIITQDVGTRNGEHYTYNSQIFYNAIHDWNGTPGNIDSGPKNILIFN